MNEVFWISFITTISGCCLVIVREVCKSKCKTFECYGIKVERDIKAEEELELAIRNPITPTARL